MSKLNSKGKLSPIQFKTIFQNFPIPIIILRGDLKVVYINENMKNSFMDTGDNDNLNRNIFDLGLIKPNFHKPLKDILKNGIKSLPVSINLKLKTKNGRNKWFQTKISKFNIEDEELIQLIFISDKTQDNKTEFSEDQTESINQFRFFADQSLVGLCVLQNDKIQYVNSKYADIFNTTKEEMLNLKRGEYLNYIHPDYRAMIKKQAEKKQKGIENTITNYVFKALKQDGTPFWVEIFSQAITFVGKTADLIVMIDKTEEERTKTRLREANDVFESISQQNIMGIFILQDDRFKYVNQKLAEITGYSVEEMLNWPPLVLYKKLIHPDFRNLLMEQGAKKQRGDTDVTAHYQYKAIRKNGEIYWVEMYSNTILYKGNHANFGIVLDITKQKRAEQRLQKNETKFAHLINNMSDILVELDEKLQIVYCSPQLYQIFGYKPEEVIGKRAYKFVHPNDFPKIVKKMKGIFQTKEDLSFEYRGVHKNGTWVDLSSKGSVYEHKGKKGLIFVGRSYGDKKKAEEKLKESEKKYRMLIENSPNAIYLVNLESKIVDCNKLALKSLSKEREDIIGQNIFHLLEFSKKETKAFLNKFFYRIKTKSFQPIEIQYVGENGNHKWLQLYYSLINLSGKSYVLIETQNITNLKLAESLLTRENIRLRELEEKNRKLINTSPNSIVLVNLKGEVLDCNNIAANNFRLSKSKAMGGNIFELLDISDSKAKRILKEFFTNIKEKTFDPIQINYEDRYDNNKWIEVYYNLVEFDKNSRVLVESVDITEKKRALELIKEENKKLKNLDKLRKEFVNRASHELKTPLTSIHGALELFTDIYGPKLDEKASEFIKIALKGSRRLKSLVFNLLDISRLEKEKKIPLNLKKHDLIGIIRSSIKEIKYLAKRRKIIIEFSHEKNIPEIVLDKFRFEQVISNLLSNALKNTPPHGEIGLNLQMNEEKIVFSVKDTGVGLTKREMTRLFQKFSKIERYGQGHHINTEGTGLGLFISREIVNMHNGIIYAKSKGRNKGATFVIELPIDNNQN